MIDIEKISKAYGTTSIFENASFKICSGERIGLVGRNGQGKTTLLRMIAGNEGYDRGKIIIPKNYTIGFVEQNITFSGKTVFEEGILGLTESDKKDHWKVKKILSGIGFSEDNMRENPYNLSGGFQVRLSLAKGLISKPDLLLLDEPTNFLDISSIRWVRKFLADWPKELVIVTHDRSFMDKVVSHIVGINDNKIKKIKGDTNKFYDQVKKNNEIYEKTRLNSERREKEICSFIEKFRAKARLAGLVQSRIKTLNKMKMKNKNYLKRHKRVEFSFNTEPYFSPIVLSVRDLSFSYADCKPLFDDLSFLVKAKDRICIIGKNGTGKTTLLKIIAGTLLPTKGKISYNSEVKKGIFDRAAIESLSEYKTVEEEVMLTHDSVNRYHARSICGKMLFEGDLALKKVGFLSGGEKSRVALAKLMVTPLNLLFLDEPTNHMDMELCNALLKALENFNGAVIMVTHDEMFLHSISKRLVVFDGGEVKFFDGEYPTFLNKEGWKNEIKFGKKLKKDSNFGKKKEIRKIRSKMIVERSRASAPIKKEMSLIEKQIHVLEDNLGELQQELILASQTKNGNIVQRLSRQIYDHERKIEIKIDKLEQLDQYLQQIKDKISKKLFDIV